MTVTRFIAIVLGTGVICSLTDWFFAGDWLHDRFTYREVWREMPESRAIALTSPLPFVTCGAFAILTVWLGVHSITNCIELAVVIWVIGPFPLILTNAAFMKLHRVFVICQLLGWLVKLLVVATACSWLLR